MVETITPLQALELAIQRAGGTQCAFADLLEVGQGTVSKWLRFSGRLPAEKVLRVEEVTGVSRHLLRPDIYPADLTPAGNFIGLDQSHARVSFDRVTVSQRERRRVAA